MKFIKRSIFIYLVFSSYAFSESSSNLILRGVVRPNINVYFDKTDGVRVLSNFYFKKKLSPYKVKSKYKHLPIKKDYKVLEVSMN